MKENHSRKRSKADTRCISAKVSPLVWVAVVLLGLSGLLLVLWPEIFIPAQATTHLPVSTERPSVRPKLAVVPGVDEYWKQIEPALEETEAADRAAMQRTLRDLRRFMARARDRVPAFSKALCGLDTRCKMVFNEGRELCERGTRDYNAELVSRTFAEHVFSKKDFEDAIQNICGSLATNLAANRDEWLACIPTKLASDELLQRFPAIPHEELAGSVQNAICDRTALLRNMSLKGEVAILATELVSSILLRVAAASAGGAVATGGATAGRSALTLAGVSSGPVGWVVLLGVMVASDIAINNYVEGRMTEQVSATLSEVEHQLLFGDGTQPGLECEFERQLDACHADRRMEIRQMVERHCSLLSLQARQEYKARLAAWRAKHEPPVSVGTAIPAWFAIAFPTSFLLLLMRKPTTRGVSGDFRNSYCSIKRHTIATTILASMILASPAEVGLAGIAGTGVKAAVKAGARIATREGTEAAVKKTSRVAIRKACTTLADDGVRLATHYGDDAARLVKLHGDDAVRFLGRHGDEGLQLVGQYGDDAFRAMQVHRGIAPGFIAEHGKTGARALQKVDREGARLLRMLQDRLGKKALQEVAESKTRLSAKEVIEIVARNGVPIGAGIGIVLVGDGIQDATQDAGRSSAELVSDVGTKIQQASPSDVTGTVERVISRSAGYTALSVSFIGAVLILSRQRRLRLYTEKRGMDKAPSRTKDRDADKKEEQTA